MENINDMLNNLFTELIKTLNEEQKQKLYDYIITLENKEN